MQELRNLALFVIAQGGDENDGWCPVFGMPESGVVPQWCARTCRQFLIQPSPK